MYSIFHSLDIGKTWGHASEKQILVEKRRWGWGHGLCIAQASLCAQHLSHRTHCPYFPPTAPVQKGARLPMWWQDFRIFVVQGPIPESLSQVTSNILSWCASTSGTNRLVVFTGFPGGSAVKNLPASARDAALIPGLGRSPGGGNGNPLQYSCLENSMGRGAWWALVHGVEDSWARLATEHAHTVSTAAATNFSCKSEPLCRFCKGTFAEEL